MGIGIHPAKKQTASKAKQDRKERLAATIFHQAVTLKQVVIVEDEDIGIAGAIFLLPQTDTTMIVQVHVIDENGSLLIHGLSRPEAILNLLLRGLAVSNKTLVFADCRRIRLLSSHAPTKQG